MSDLLKDARDRIDRLDAEIQKLIAERARIAQSIRGIKAQTGAANDHYRPGREAEVLRRAIERNRELGGPLDDEVMARLMREIMSACLALESPLAVAFLGPEGTYTEAAVHKHFGAAVNARAVTAIDEIFREVVAEKVQYGVVPVENSIGGVVSHTLDLLAGAPQSVCICGEVLLPVHHHLLSNHERLDQIRHVYAHAQSFAQCRVWLDEKLPQAERVPVFSNGEAARLVKERGEGAAIAGAKTAEIYGLKIIESRIEDDPNNATRFLVIGRQFPEPTGKDMTSLVCSARQDHPGALFALLEPFAQASINLQKIESRPSKRGPWDYNFFIDLEGHRADPPVGRALGQVQSRSAFFKILGSYPRYVCSS